MSEEGVDVISDLPLRVRYALFWISDLFVDNQQLSSVDSIHSLLLSSDLLGLTIPERRIAGDLAPDRSICRSRILWDTKFGEAREAGRTAALGWDRA